MDTEFWFIAQELADERELFTEHEREAFWLTYNLANPEEQDESFSAH